MSLQEFMKRQKHLPWFLRDFHRAKTLFKTLDHYFSKIRPGNDDDISWVQGHIFVMDRFLPFMAAHGYTLQKSRAKGIKFADLDTSIKEYEQIEFKSLMTMLDSVSKK